MPLQQKRPGPKRIGTASCEQLAHTCTLTQTNSGLESSPWPECPLHNLATASSAGTTERKTRRKEPTVARCALGNGGLCETKRDVERNAFLQPMGTCVPIPRASSLELSNHSALPPPSANQFIVLTILAHGIILTLVLVAVAVFALDVVFVGMAKIVVMSVVVVVARRLLFITFVICCCRRLDCCRRCRGHFRRRHSSSPSVVIRCRYSPSSFVIRRLHSSSLMQLGEQNNKE